MGILIDSSVLITIERGRLEMEELFAQAPGEDWCIAAITAAELLVGFHRADLSMRDSRSQFIETLFRRLVVVNFDLPAARVYAKLSSQLASTGAPVGLHDLQIAATAIVRDDQIATLDRRSFPRIEGVRLFPLT
ncbi:MAG: PIN domain-containing protein [Burkholderiales bacterium]|nr:PIN domain-containing protein [Phycisphaerae bacterium]